MAKAPKYFTVKPKSEVKAPRTYDPGKGRPKEHLSYLNKDEMKALRRMNGNNMERGPKGLPSFPPADAIGSSSKAGTTTGKTTTKSSSSTSSPGSKGSGTSTAWGGGGGGGGGSKPTGGKPSGGGGNNGGGGGNKPSGGMMGGTGSGGSSRTAPSTGKPAGGGAGAGKGSKNDIGVAGVPGGAGRFGGPQARNGNLGNTAPAGNSFGPRAPQDKTGNTVTPSRMAQENTLARIAAGSSVVGRQNLGKLQDQVPKDPTYRSTPSQVVKLDQKPTVRENIFEGANSLLADPSNQFGMSDAYDPLGSVRVPRRTTNVSYDPTRSPITQQEMRNMQDVASIYGADMAGLPTPTGRAFPGTQRPAPGPTKYQDRVPASYDQTVVKDVAYNNGIPDKGIRRTTNAYTPPQAASVTKQPAPVTSYGPVIANPADPYGVRYAKTAGYLGQVPQVREPAGQPYGSAMPQPSAPVQRAAAMPSGTYFGGPQSYPRGANVSPANTQETQAEQTVRETETPGVGPSNPVGQFIADRFADRFNTRVAPSQQDSALVRADQALGRVFGTPGPDSAYARAMANADNRGSERPSMQTPSQPSSYATPVTTPTSAAPPPPALPPLPPYVNYQNLPSTYSGGVAPAQPITDYINGGYGLGYADGGAVSSGDGGSSFFDRVQWGMKNSPSKSPFHTLAYAIGIPLFSKANGPAEWHQVERDMRMAQMMNGQTPAAKPAAPAPKPAEPYKPVQQLSQYVLPPPDSRISDYNNADVLGQQEQLFRLPEKRGGGVGDGIDAAIRLAKSFS